MKKICYFGIYDPQHWRTRIVSSGFRRLGYEVIECRVNPREIKGLEKYIELYKKYKNLKTEFDYVVVGFPGYLAVFVARIVASCPIIFDAYISFFDGIRDRRDYSLYHPMMWYAWLIDFFDGVFADVVLTINYAYKDFFVRKLRVKESKVEVLHKGADETVFFPRQKNVSLRDKYIIGWWGSFIPLHGVPVIINAANHLRDRKDIEFHVIGGGQLKNEIERQIAKKNLSNVKLISFIPRDQLIEKISEFDIALGIFGSSAKSGRCVTNKVYEAMAMGKPIITQDSSANREIFTHKSNAYLVPAGDPKALADAILELIANEELRASIAENSLELFKRRFISEKIEDELSDIIKRHETR